MKKKLLSNLLLGSVFLFISCSVDANSDETSAETKYDIDLNLSQLTDWQMANEILNLINLHRVTINLPEIRNDHNLASAYAVSHTNHMIEVSEINHDNFHIRSEALIQAGALHVAENVAFGYGTAQGVVSAWLNSSSHKSIIEGNYTHSGFGILKDTHGNYYFTQLFYRK